MKNLKNTFAAFTLVAALTFGTTFAHAGIIIASDRGSDKSEPCREEKKDDSLRGIIIANVGIIIATVGIIIAGAKDDSNETCGIRIA